MKRRTGQDRSIATRWRPATRAVRGGTARSEWGETSEAIFLTSGYAYDSAEQAAARFRGEQVGMTYSRLQNPTVEMLEQRLALMEGAEAARSMASGMAAMTAALLCQLRAGDHVVAARTMFGSCRWLTDTLLPQFGMSATIVDGRDTQAWKDSIRPETKLFFFETPANPTLDIVDLEAVCRIAKDAGVVTVVDNAFATSALQRPLEFGADVVAYSATKLMDGQGRVLAGAVCGSQAMWVISVDAAGARSPRACASSSRVGVGAAAQAPVRRTSDSAARFTARRPAAPGRGRRSGPACPRCRC
jgi:cystathionine beta-lyase/cystathionine gamma-synthase